MKTLEGRLQWVEETGPAPSPHEDAVAGVHCVECNVALFPEDKLEVEQVLRSHEGHGDLYVITQEPNGDVVRRGRVRRLH